MEVLLFIKHLRLKGAVYYKTWMPLLIQFNSTDGQEIKLSVHPDVSKSTHYRIIDYGLKVFSNYVTNFTIKKNRNVLIINRCNPIQIEQPLKKQKRVSEPQSIKTNEIIEKIISYLNECTGKNYKTNSKIAISNINYRLKDGYVLEDFIKVIEVKSTKWLGTKMEDFLTPTTLFGDKMESYLNENIITEKTKQQKNYEQVSQATELGWDKNIT